MDFISDKLSFYIENHSSEESDVLYELNRQTHLKALNPRMLSGHIQGRVLSMLSKMIAPNRILEIGTYTGYSALCLAEGLKEGGELITIDKNEELKELALEYIKKAEFEDKIQVITGDAMQIIPNLDLHVELVFIDADKVNYSNYYDLLIDKLPHNSYIIADNILWSGKVIDKNTTDKDTMALKLFNEKIQSDIRVENVIFPIRDGLMVIRKK